MTDIAPERFETGRPMLLAGLRSWYAFEEGPAKIPDDWKRFVSLLPLPGQVGWITYGAMCDTDMEARRFEYMCAVEVETLEGLPDGLGRMRVPEAHYAVFRHDGPVSGIRRTWDAACQWLETSGRKGASTPDFERYGPGFDPVAAQGDTEIWLPVTRP